LPIFLEFLTRAGQSPVVWQATVTHLRKYEALFAGMIQEGIDEGSLQAVDAELAGHAILAFAIGLLAPGLLDPHGADWGQVAQDGMRILLEGLERKE
jgi:hypothetical protein